MTQFRIALIIAVGLACAFPRVASAMKCPDDATATCQCVHPPVDLPGLTGAPEWFDFDGDGFWRPELQDPRWSGGPLEFLSSSDQLAITDAVQARVVQAGNFLYVSLQALTDDEGPEATGIGKNDFAYFGITQGSASQAYGVQMTVYGDGSAGSFPPGTPHDTPLPQPPTAGAVVYWPSDATGSFASSTQQNGAPSWMDQIAIWLPSATVIPPGTNRRWAVTFRVNTGTGPTGLNASPGSIRMFFGLGIHMTTGIPLFANAAPASGASAIGTTIIPTNVTNWVRYAQVGSACTDGVTVSDGDIGVFKGTPGGAPSGTLSNQICAANPCPASDPGGNPDNVFRVIARNVTNAAGLTQWQLRARLRIADWGSTIANRKNGPWKDIATTPTGTAILTAPITNVGTGAPFSNANGWYWQDAPDAPGSTTSNVVVDYQCDRGSNPYCPTLDDPTVTHQCMLVEVGDPTGTFEISQGAVYRNMDYYSMSSLDQPATISLKGLKAATGLDGERDVYLYVETDNMPAHADRPLWLPAEQMYEALQIAQHPAVIPKRPPQKAPPGKQRAAVVKRAGPKADALREKFDQMALARAAQIANSAKKIGTAAVSSTISMSPTQILDAVWPTYRIRPYYDTGKTMLQKGVPSKVLAPMASFGFRMSHDGPFYGFIHELQAANPGVQLTRLSEYWYLLHFKDESTPFHLRTKISAEEKPVVHGPGPGPIPNPGPCPECGKCPECKVTPGACNCELAAVSPRTGLVAAGLIVLGLAFGLRRRRRQ